jgi:hypothetical protein
MRIIVMFFCPKFNVDNIFMRNNYSEIAKN